MESYASSIEEMLAYYPKHFAFFNAVISVNAISSIMLCILTIFIMFSTRNRVMASYRLVLLNLIVWCVLFNIPGPLVFHPVMLLPSLYFGNAEFSFEGMLLYNVHPKFSSSVTTTAMVVIICISVFASFIATAISFIYYHYLLTGVQNSFFLSHKGSTLFLAVELLSTLLVVGAVIATAQHSVKYPNAVLLFNFRTVESLIVVALTASIYISLYVLMTFSLVKVFRSYRQLQRQGGGDSTLLNAHRYVFRVLTANFAFLIFFEVVLPVSLSFVAMFSLPTSLRFVCSFGMAFSVSLVPNCACILILVIVKPYRTALKKLFSKIARTGHGYAVSSSALTAKTFAAAELKVWPNSKLAVQGT